MNLFDVSPDLQDTLIDDLNSLEDKEVFTSSEISEIPKILHTEITDKVPGMEKALVCGDPFRLGNVLDFQQGYDNPYYAFGTCGLTSVANVCTLGGVEVTEPEVVDYAMKNKLCITSEEDPRYSNLGSGGATTIHHMISLLNHYGFESHCEFANDAATCERLASAIEGGHGVIVCLNSGILQDRPWKTADENGNIFGTHAVTLTGTVRDVDTGELKGFYLCDSTGQNPNAGRTFVSLDKMNECYTNITGGYAVITDNPIRN